jgi:hypothetical protein
MVQHQVDRCKLFIESGFLETKVMEVENIAESQSFRFAGHGRKNPNLGHSS